MGGGRGAAVLQSCLCLAFEHRIFSVGVFSSKIAPNVLRVRVVCLASGLGSPLASRFSLAFRVLFRPLVQRETAARLVVGACCVSCRRRE